MWSIVLSGEGRSVDTVKAEKSSKVYKVGSLEYNFRQLAAVFFWMLLTAVNMTLLVSTFRQAAPFIFREYQLSDTFIVMFLGSVYSLMNMFMNPVLSFRSDRCRSPRGRRIPFILHTTIPLGLAMALIPFYPQLTTFLPVKMFCGISFMEIFFAVGVILFWFNWLFVGAIYYYLIPDVIPLELMGRYYGFFRMAGVIAGIIFSKFVFQYAVSHPQWVFPLVGLVYTVSVLGMCFFVKEGEYPVVESVDERPVWYKRLGSAIKSYASECFCQKYYWCYYIVGTIYGISGGVAVFANFFYTDGCRMTLQEVGDLGVYIGFASFITCMVAGYLVDRIGGFYSAIAGVFFMGMTYLGGAVYIHDFASALIWRIPFCVASGLYAVACGKILVEIFPRSRFGQFASAQAMFISLVVALVNYPVGKLSDFMKNTAADATLMCGSIDLMPFLKNYRFINYWYAVCYLLAAGMLVYFYFHYQKKRKDSAVNL